MIASTCFMCLAFIFTVQGLRTTQSLPPHQDNARLSIYNRPSSDNDDEKITDEIDEAKYLKFPKGFIIGAGTASYQIEGGWNASGKGVSVWDHFVHSNSNNVLNNDNGDVACDSYNRYKEDVAVIKKIGFDVYRFSVSWTRILPTGFANEINEDGVAYYDGLLDELLANNIEPIVTMLHWDHPQTIEDLGGWTNKMMVDWFADYARVLFQKFGSKVKKWVTLNEPDENCLSGYGKSLHAPGKNLPGIADYLCGHNVLKAHAKVYRMYQDEFKSTQNGSVGITIHMPYFYPNDPKTDEPAVDKAFYFTAGWLIHPIFSKNGDYHEVLKNLVGNRSRAEGYPRSRLPKFSKQWIEYIRGSADFLGLNHYTSSLVTDGLDGPRPSFFVDRGVIRSADPSWDTGASAWLQIVPKGLGDLLRRLAIEYDNPTIYITENGVSDHGETDDNLRIQYYRDYVKEMLIAINRDGVNVKGYVLWSLLDNFEWHRGYSEKFGVVSVNFTDPSRERRLKDSAIWWKGILKTRSLVSDFVDTPI